MQKVCKVMLISSKAKLYGPPDFRRPHDLGLRELDFFGPFLGHAFLEAFSRFW